MIDAGADAGVYPANAPPTGSCANGWCWVYPLPQGWELTGLWGTGGSDVWAIAFTSYGGRNAYLHFDGTSWTSMDAPAACSAAGGPSWGSLPTRGNGPCPSFWNSSWTGSPSTSPVGGLGANDFWTGSTGTTKHWDGSQWTSYAAPTTSWTPIAFGGSGSATLTVSNAGGIAQWLGTTWGIADAGTHAANAGVVIDSTHVVIAQNAGAVSMWNNGTWTTVTAPVAANWERIIATSPTDVWVASSYQAVTQLYHWNGTSWSSAPALTASGSVNGMWRDASGAVWLAMSSSQVMVWNGTAWSSKTIGDNFVSQVWGTAWDDIWTLEPGYPGNRTLHWDGTTWSHVAFPFAPDDGSGNGYTIEAIWGSARNDYWIVGGHGINPNLIQRMLFHWDGSTWSTVGPFGTEDYNVSPGFWSIWGAAANDVYALSRTALYHYNGSSWTAVAAVPGGWRVFGSSGSDVYVISVDGTSLSHWDGSSWTTKTMPAAQSFGWANSPTDVWMGSLHYDGTFFVSLSPSASGQLVGSATDMFMFDQGGSGPQVIERTGGLGGTVQTQSSLLLPASVWRTPDGHIFAAGGGLIVH